MFEKENCCIFKILKKRISRLNPLIGARGGEYHRLRLCDFLKKGSYIYINVKNYIICPKDSDRCWVSVFNDNQFRVYDSDGRIINQFGAGYMLSEFLKLEKESLALQNKQSRIQAENEKWISKHRESNDNVSHFAQAIERKRIRKESESDGRK